MSDGSRCRPGTIEAVSCRTRPVGRPLNGPGMHTRAGLHIEAVCARLQAGDRLTVLCGVWQPVWLTKVTQRTWGLRSPLHGWTGLAALPVAWGA